MARLSLLLLLALSVAAIGLVTSQHKARKLFAELEREQARAQALDVEWGQLQLEQSTWAMHSRVAKLATERLRMRQADAKRTVVVGADAPEAGR
ncbi:MAG: cell division protein FtsL [Burkholderiales bacterium]|jgi:cell division protein FtsL|nr:cell division protein FtsL [Burkholderiales bacterium]